jgi:hypothetical protein
VATSLSLSAAVEQLRLEVGRRPAIESQRHWLTERCAVGTVNETSVRIDVKYRYLGRIYAWNSWTVGFTGVLLDDQGRTVLQGEIDLRRIEARGGLRALRLFAVALIALAVVIALEGVASGRLDEIAAILLAVPGILLFVGIPGLEAFLHRRVANDAALLVRFIEHSLQAERTTGSAG